MITGGPPEREKWQAKNFPGCELITTLTENHKIVLSKINCLS